jgi:hypothetical protein
VSAQRLALVGVVHLPPLPGSPRARLTAPECAASAARDAEALAKAGYDAVIVENFGDAPFFADRVPPITVAAMTACALSVRSAAPSLALGMNVLRNDAESALSIAVAAGAAFIRVNVHSGARVTDQGVVQSRAAETLRLRRALGAESIAIWADVDVKHSSPLGAQGPGHLEQEVHDVVERGLASAVLVTGEGTGRAAPREKLVRVRAAAGSARVLVASGAAREALPDLAKLCDGVIVGTALRKDGRPGGPVDADCAAAFAADFRAAFG